VLLRADISSDLLKFDVQQHVTARMYFPINLVFSTRHRFLPKSGVNTSLPVSEYEGFILRNSVTGTSIFRPMQSCSMDLIPQLSQYWSFHRRYPSSDFFVTISWPIRRIKTTLPFRISSCLALVFLRSVNFTAAMSYGPH
jgi:hypothetical protein